MQPTTSAAVTEDLLRLRLTFFSMRTQSLARALRCWQFFRGLALYFLPALVCGYANEWRRADEQRTCALSKIKSRVASASGCRGTSSAVTRSRARASLRSAAKAARGCVVFA